jgi:thiamine biosynthesis lipoprotein
MGTMATVVIPAGGGAQAREAALEAFREIERIEGLISPFRQGSEAWVLNRRGQVPSPSLDLRRNIEKAIEYGRLSQGAFDITVQPLLDLYRESFKVRGRAPLPEEIAPALRRVDYRRISIGEDRITIGAGQAITLGALGHGYAADRALEVLRARGIRRALVDIGGEIGVLGAKADGVMWTVAIQDPWDKDRPAAVIDLPPDKALATSGSYESYYDPEKRFHHIIDPKTGISAAGLVSVTVITDHVLDANGLSVSVFVLGEERGLRLLKDTGHAEGLILTADGRRVETPGFCRYVRSVQPDRQGGAD